jgi:hypothetical protein
MSDLGPVGRAPGEGVEPATSLRGNGRQGLCDCGVHEGIPVPIAKGHEMRRTLRQQSPYRLIRLL